MKVRGCFLYPEGKWGNLPSTSYIFAMMIMIFILSSFPVRVEVCEESTTSEQNRINNKYLQMTFDYCLHARSSGRVLLLQVNKFGITSEQPAFVMPYMGTLYFDSSSYVHLDEPTLKEYIRKQM
jgi:hypothetical protein